MSEFFELLAWVGIFAPVALGAIGSVLGCSYAGQAAVGALLDTDSGYGRYIGLSVLPSTFVIYGIVLMFSLQNVPIAGNEPGLFAIGVLSGISLLYAASWQGRLAASAINTIKEKPSVFGLSITPVAIVEGFGVFVFIFALVLIGSLSPAS